MRDNWIFFENIDWNDKIEQVHIDTRDFHASVIERPSKKMPDIDKIIKYPKRFFHTVDELKEMLVRYYNDSGGKTSGNWRFFSLEELPFWFKYIRMLKTEHGWIICDPDFNIINKSVLASKVKKDEHG